jgi:hypothetical protein
VTPLALALALYAAPVAPDPDYLQCRALLAPFDQWDADAGFEVALARWKYFDYRCGWELDRPWLADYRSQADRVRNCWSLLRYARFWTTRGNYGEALGFLDDLRATLKDEAFFHGWMPDPTWPGRVCGDGLDAGQDGPAGP